MAENTMTAPCDIKIDRDGVWYYRGAEMCRKEILKVFFEHVKHDEDGRYIIEMNGERCCIDVEDTVFVVRAVYRTDSGGKESDGFHLLLSDDTVEPLAAETFRLADDNAPYCMVKNHRFEARFNRASYYQLAEHIQYDEKCGRFYLSCKGDRTYINHPLFQDKREGGDLSC